MKIKSENSPFPSRWHPFPIKIGRNKRSADKWITLQLWLNRGWGQECVVWFSASITHDISSQVELRVVRHKFWFRYIKPWNNKPIKSYNLQLLRYNQRDKTLCQKPTDYTKTTKDDNTVIKHGCNFQSSLTQLEKISIIRNMG